VCEFGGDVRAAKGKQGKTYLCSKFANKKDMEICGNYHLYFLEFFLYIYINLRGCGSGF
jgi:hypothetical protein